MECRWASEHGISVVGYDIFDVLVNFWQVLLKDPVALSDELSSLSPTKTEYARIKEELMSWERTQELLKDWPTDHYQRTPTKIESTRAAAYYYFNHNLSYGPMYLGWMSKIYENQNKWVKMVETIRSFRNPNLDVRQGEFTQTIHNHPTDMLYLDPPYYLEKDADNKMFKGIYPNANVDVHHTGFDHEMLRDLLHAHHGPWVLSYNNCETIREWYGDYEQHFPEWHYSYALGETRVGKNRTSLDPKQSHEILIVNRKKRKNKQ